MDGEAVLQTLIGDTLTVEDFTASYWEKKPLVVHRHEPDFYLGFFTKDMMLDIFDRHRLQTSQHMNVVKYEAGKKQLVEVGPVATRAEIAAAMDQGATVQFFQPQRYSDSLWHIQSSLEELFGDLCGASAYLTPPRAQGLAPHWDDVEVFILQTEGTKQWKIYQPLQDLPTEHSADLHRSEIGEPIEVPAAAPHWGELPELISCCVGC